MGIALSRYTLSAVLVFTLLFLASPKEPLANAEITLSPETQQAMDRGLSAAKQKEWDLAVKYFSEARKAAPTLSLALFNLALAYDNLGGRELITIAWYQAFLASSPDSPNAQQVRERIVDLEVKAEASIGKLFRRVREGVAQITDEQASAYHSIAKEQAEAGDFAGAKETAGRITNDEYYKSYTYQNIAEWQAKAGDISGAKTTTTMITYKHADMKPYTLLSIVTAQAKAGDFAGAKSTFAQMSDENERLKSKAFRQIVKAQVKSGDVAGARESISKAVEMAAKIPEGTAYVEIAEIQIKMGDVAGARDSIARALESASIVDGINAKRNIYTEIAEVQIKAGDLAGALASLAKAQEAIDQDPDESWVKYWDINKIVKLQVMAGDVTGAKATAARIPQEKEGEKELAYAMIAEAQAKAGDITGAKATAGRRLKKDWAKYHAYKEIAKTQVKSGDIPGAKASIALALKMAAQTSDASQRFSEIAEVQVEAGDFDGARSTAAKITDDYGGGIQIHRLIAKAQGDLTGEEIFDWSEVALRTLNIQWFTDLKGYLKSLKHTKVFGEQLSPDVTIALVAGVAKEWTNALRKFREKEAEWQKKRAEAAGL